MSAVDECLEERLIDALTDAMVGGKLTEERAFRLVRWAVEHAHVESKIKMPERAPSGPAEAAAALKHVGMHVVIFDENTTICPHCGAIDGGSSCCSTTEINDLEQRLDRTKASLRELHDYLREHSAAKDTLEMLTRSHAVLNE